MHERQWAAGGVKVSAVRACVCAWLVHAAEGSLNPFWGLPGGVAKVGIGPQPLTTNLPNAHLFAAQRQVCLPGGVARVAVGRLELGAGLMQKARRCAHVGKWMGASKTRNIYF